MAEKWEVLEPLLFRDGTSENAGLNLRVIGENFQGVATVLIHVVRVFRGRRAYAGGGRRCCQSRAW